MTSRSSEVFGLAWSNQHFHSLKGSFFLLIFNCFHFFGVAKSPPFTPDQTSYFVPVSALHQSSPPYFYVRLKENRFGLRRGRREPWVISLSERIHLPVCCLNVSFDIWEKNTRWCFISYYRLADSVDPSRMENPKPTSFPRDSPQVDGERVHLFSVGLISVRSVVRVERERHRKHWLESSNSENRRDRG